MVQPLLGSKLAITSRAEAMPVLEPGDSSQEKSRENLGATCPGDTAALVGIATHWEEHTHGQENGKILSPECLLQHYL